MYDRPYVSRKLYYSAIFPRATTLEASREEALARRSRRSRAARDCRRDCRSAAAEIVVPGGSVRYCLLAALQAVIRDRT